MSGILLSPGPVSNVRVVQSLSGVFMSAVNKSKFLAAANRLEAAGLGSLVTLDAISNRCQVFVKKSPAEIYELLQIKENQDICTFDEFRERFDLPTTARISQKVQEALVQMGLVPPECFKQKERRGPKPSQDFTKQEYLG